MASFLSLWVAAILKPPVRPQERYLLCQPDFVSTCDNWEGKLTAPRQLSDSDSTLWSRRLHCTAPDGKSLKLCKPDSRTAGMNPEKISQFRAHLVMIPAPRFAYSLREEMTKFPFRAPVNPCIFTLMFQNSYLWKKKLQLDSIWYCRVRLKMNINNRHL